MKSYIFTFPWILNLHLYLEPEAPGSSYGRGVWRWWQGQIKKKSVQKLILYFRASEKKNETAFLFYVLLLISLETASVWEAPA